jgi:hypothetical protein
MGISSGGDLSWRDEPLLQKSRMLQIQGAKSEAVVSYCELFAIPQGGRDAVSWAFMKCKKHGKIPERLALHL